MVISSSLPAPTEGPAPRSSAFPAWVKGIPFFVIHLACLLVFLPQVEATATALILCVGLYLLRMFGITAAYHRYFSHRAYKTSRGFQFVMAWIGCSAMQKGPLWWASHHRHHHLHSDQDEDIHSPHVDSLWWSHVGWVISDDYQETDWQAIHDFGKYPELRWLDRNHWVPGLVLAAICYLVGGLSGLVWGFFVSTVITYHATFCINSFCHIIGKVRYKTTDESKNSLLMALITLGEGWHNNHHYYQSSANQGFFWWEIDISYYLLRVLSWCGLVWDLRKVPLHKLAPPVERPTTEIVPVRVATEPTAGPPIYTPVMAKAKHAMNAAGQAVHTASDVLAHAAASARQAAQAASQALAHAAEAASHAAAAARQSAGNAATSATQALAHAAETAANAAKQAAQSAAQTIAHAAEVASHAATAASANATAAVVVATPIALATAEAVTRSGGA